MGKTRTAMPDPEDPKKIIEALQAAAQPLEVKSETSLLYNQQAIDYIVNGQANGATIAAWYYWSQIPELRYTTRYVSNALSIARLYAAKANPKGGPPTRLPEDHPASELLAEFAGGTAGQSEMLDRLGTHLTVAGDSVIIGPKSGSGGEQEPFDRWRVYSTEEVSSRSRKIYVKLPGNAKEQQIPDSTLAVRIWRPHPVFWWDAESPVKGSFAVLKELDLLDQHVQASAVSRLAGAGLMGIPDELDLPNADSEIAGTEIDKFVALLTEVMGMAIKNRSSAAALVPIMLRGPAEYIDKIKHFDFTTDFSQMVPELRMTAIRRLALGMDVPPEILLGSAQSTSWSAWQTDESTLRVHLIPFLKVITDSLTVGWLRPMLRELPLTAAQEAEIDDIVVYFDVSELKIRQDISGDAEALYDRGVIDETALRNAIGYGDDDAPDNKELARQILLQMVRSTSPELVTYAVEALRKNFGLKDLPKMEQPEPPPPKAPAVEVPKPETAEPGSNVPGERSQDKQTSAPPVPKVGDNSNNGPTP